MFNVLFCFELTVEWHTFHTHTLADLGFRVVNGASSLSIEYPEVLPSPTALTASGFIKTLRE